MTDRGRGIPAETGSPHSSSRSSRRRRTGSGSAWPSAGRSWRRTAGRSGPRTTPRDARGHLPPSPCPPWRSARERARPTVYVVDDEPETLKAIARLLRAAGFYVAAFGSPASSSSNSTRRRPAVSSSTFRCRRSTGLEVQQELDERRCALPIVFLTGRADVPTSVRAMKRGAADFLTKPVDDEDLLAAVRRASRRTLRRGRTAREVAAIEARLASADAARAGGPRARRLGKAEQADRRRPRHGGEDDQGPPRAASWRRSARPPSRTSSGWRSGPESGPPDLRAGPPRRPALSAGALLPR